MKEAIGGVSLFQIVILFLLLFTGVMCLTINHSKAYGVKDKIINILETDKLSSYEKSNNNELNSETVDNIIEHLNESGYRITGRCPSDEWTGYDRNGVKTNNNASFCIKTVDVSKAYYNDAVEKCKNNGCTVTSGHLPKMVYYDIIVFYQLDIPIIKQIFNLKLYGSTKILFGENSI